MTYSLGAETFPFVGLFIPAKIFNKVDFPAPFLPIKATLSFSFITNETSLNNVLPLNSTPKPSIEIIFYNF